MCERFQLVKSFAQQGFWNKMALSLRCANDLRVQFRSHNDVVPSCERFSPSFSFVQRRPCVTRTISDSGKGAGPSDGPSSRARNRGTVRFRFQGRNHGFFRGETAVLYDFVERRGYHFRGRNILRPHHGSEVRRNTRSSSCPRFWIGAGNSQLACPEEHRRTELRFGPEMGEKTASLPPQARSSQGTGRRGSGIQTSTRSLLLEENPSGQVMAGVEPRTRSP